MRSIKMIGLAVVAVLALGALTTSAAFGEEFIASKVSIKLKGKALNTQKFKTGTGATVECTKLSISAGETKALKSTEQKATIKYETCSVLLFGSATVSAAEYKFFDLPIGGVEVEKAIFINGKGLGEECEVEVKAPQTIGAGTNAKSTMEILYKNITGSGGKKALELVSEVEKIKSKVLKSTSTTNCGTVGQEAEGIYTGKAEVEAEGTGNEIETK